MTSLARLPDVEAPQTECGRNGGLTAKSGSHLSQVNMDTGVPTAELRTRIVCLEYQLAATNKSSIAASKTLKAVYREDAHAHRVANPAPLGLFAFALTTILLQGASTAWTEPETDYITYAFGLFFGGLTQFIAGMWALWRNNLFDGTALSGLGAFWMGVAIYHILALAGTPRGATGASHGTAMMLFLWGFFTFTLWIQTFRMNVGKCALFRFLTITFFLLGSGEYKEHAEKAGGYFGVATGTIARYISTAELTNGVYERKILPLGTFATGTKEPESGPARPDAL